MTSKSPLLTLNNGVQIPAIGLGVLQSAPDQTPTAVESAIAHGYRLIDTAAAYANERQVGEGMRQSGISRDDMFIETKVWIIDDGYEATLQSQPQAVERSGPVSPSDKSRCELHRLVCMTTYQQCPDCGATVVPRRVLPQTKLPPTTEFVCMGCDAACRHEDQQLGKLPSTPERSA